MKPHPWLNDYFLHSFGSFQSYWLSEAIYAMNRVLWTLEPVRFGYNPISPLNSYVILGHISIWVKLGYKCLAHGDFPGAWSEETHVRLLVQGWEPNQRSINMSSTTFFPSHWHFCDSSLFSTIVTSLCPFHTFLIFLPSPKLLLFSEAELSLTLFFWSCVIPGLSHPHLWSSYHLYIHDPQMPRPLWSCLLGSKLLLATAYCPVHPGVLLASPTQLNSTH